MSKSIKLKDNTYWDLTSVANQDTDLYGALFYRSGDKQTFPYEYSFFGYLTSNKTQLVITVTFSKSMKYVEIDDVKLNVNIRNATGGYLIESAFVSGGYDLISAMSSATYAKSDNLLKMELTLPSAASEYSNNSLVEITIESGYISFK